MIRAPAGEGSSGLRGFAPGAGRRDCNVPPSFKAQARPAGGQVHPGGRAPAGEVSPAKDSRVLRAVLIFLPLDSSRARVSLHITESSNPSSYIFSFRHGAPSVDGGIMGLKPVQGMSVRRLRAGGCFRAA